MKLFQKTIFPFSITGAVCNLAIYENEQIFTFNSQTEFEQSLEILREFEITKFLFLGFTTEKNWETLKSKLELNGYQCQIFNPLNLPTEKSSLKEFIDYTSSLEKFFNFIGKSNFKLYFPLQKKNLAIEFVFSCFLYLDSSVTISELEEYFFGKSKLETTIISKLESFNKFLQSNPYLFLKKIPSLKKRAKYIQEYKKEISSTVKAGEFDLNLSALNEKEPKLSQTTSIEFNLSSLTEEPPPPEDKSSTELLQDVLELANSIDLPVEVESSEQLQANQEISSQTSETQEDFTFSTLIDLDAITESTIEAYEEEKKEEVNLANSSQTTESTEDTQVPFPEVLDTQKVVSISEWQTAQFSALVEQSLEDDELNPNAEIVFEEDKYDSVDRYIKDAITKEVLLEEEDPGKTQEKSEKKESKPKTIIVTAKKEENIQPLSKENFEKISSQFKAIQLD